MRSIAWMPPFLSLLFNMAGPISGGMKNFGFILNA